jgi:hypothetical protein
MKKLTKSEVPDELGNYKNLGVKNFPNAQKRTGQN